MVHYIALYKLKPNTTDETIEGIIRESRSCFHRISEAHNFRSGRNIRSDNPFSFFLSADFENLEKLKMFQDDPVYIKFDSRVVRNHITEFREFLYETEPGKNPEFS
ncbi:MAG: Dabb family protein [Verrucomicrobiales bacterium]|nr:Dabb family protein [Verrucomicrobiales bacterium]